MFYQLGTLKLKFDRKEGFPILKNPTDLVDFPVLLEESIICSYDELDNNGPEFLESVKEKLSFKLFEQLESQVDDKSFFNIIRLSVRVHTKDV